MHLQKKFGGTIKDIKKDNLKIDYIIKNFPKGNKDIDIINAFSEGAHLNLEKSLKRLDLT